jgi:hypothetical protein
MPLTGHAHFLAISSRVAGRKRADPAVTLRIYAHVLREHALGVGDIFAQAVKAPVSKSVSTPQQQR